MMAGALASAFEPLYLYSLSTMYLLAHQVLAWVIGPEEYLFVALVLVGGFSATATGDPTPVLAGCALGLLAGVLTAHAITFSPSLQTAVAAALSALLPRVGTTASRVAARLLGARLFQLTR